MPILSAGDINGLSKKPYSRERIGLDRQQALDKTDKITYFAVLADRGFQ